MSKKNKNAGNIAFGVLFGIAGLIAAVVLVWPSLPRPTYLSQGCSMTTSGTVANVFGTIYSGLVRVVVLGSLAALTFWLGYLLVSLFKHLGTWLWTFKQWLFRPKQQKQPKQAKEKPQEDYKRTDIKYTDEFNSQFAYDGLTFLQRRIRGFMYQYLYDPANFYLNVTLTAAAAGVGLGWLTEPYVCHETGDQTFAFIVTLAVITIVAEIALILTWRAIYPTADTKDDFVRTYGDLHALWSGSPRHSLVSEAAIADFVGQKTVDGNRCMRETLEQALKAKAIPELYGSTLFDCRSISFAHGVSDGVLHARMEFRGSPGTTLQGQDLAFIAAYKNGVLTAGKSFKTLYKIQTGVKIVVSEQLPLGKFAEGVASVLAWLINNDEEVRKCVNKRPIMAPGLLLTESERPPKPGPNQIKRGRVTPKPPPSQPSKQIKKRRK